jgi:hypothetical protein
MLRERNKNFSQKKERNKMYARGRGDKRNLLLLSLVAHIPVRCNGTAMFNPGAKV